MVNKQGERFVNESLPYDFRAHAAWQQEGNVWIEIFDSTWPEDVKRFHCIGCARIEPSGYNPVLDGIFGYDMIEVYNQQMIEAGALVKADTIEELAEGLGLPVDTLVATVARYNGLNAAGEGLDFGKEPVRLSAIDTPPYYGITLGGMLMCTCDGLMVDDNMRVLDAEEKPIEGLYAVGNNCGCFFAGCYPELIVGMTAGKAQVLGYVTGKEIARS